MKHIQMRVLAVGLAILAAVFLLADVSIQAAAKASLDRSRVTVEVGKSTTVKVRNAGKKVSWKILSGEKNISIKGGKKSVKITGKKAGEAKLQAKVGNKKLVCRITFLQSHKIETLEDLQKLAEDTKNSEVTIFTTSVS